jgi:hypothetical protein
VKSPFEGKELPPDWKERLRNIDYREDELKERLKKFRTPITLDVLFKPIG